MELLHRVKNVTLFKLYLEVSRHPLPEFMLTISPIFYLIKKTECIQSFLPLRGWRLALRNLSVYMQGSRALGDFDVRPGIVSSGSSAVCEIHAKV